MWQPGAALALVHAKALESELNALRERGPATGRIPEDEHADGPRLAVAHRLEEKRRGLGRLTPEDVDDRLERTPLLAPEERERDVEAGDVPSGEVLPAPVDERLDGPGRELQRKEEPDPVISPDGSRQARVPV